LRCNCCVTKLDLTSGHGHIKMADRCFELRFFLQPDAVKFKLGLQIQPQISAGSVSAVRENPSAKCQDDKKR
jgi:hypothetical protein